MTFCMVIKAVCHYRETAVFRILEKVISPLILLILNYD